MLYFAYGSNLDWTQMRDRCPSAQFVTVAKFPGHRLAITRKSKKRGCGVADVIPDNANEVLGAVFDIAEADFVKLDESEGFQPGRPLAKKSYNREQRHVFRDGGAEEPILSWVYFANPQDDPPLPNAVYKALIVEGAKFWHLPPDYIAQLETIATA